MPFLEENNIIRDFFSKTVPKIEKMKLPINEFLFVNATAPSKEKIITINKMDKVLEMLGQGFVRCHKSYIVNRNKIRKYAADRVVLFDETEIFVSKKYRHEIKAAILNSI